MQFPGFPPEPSDNSVQFFFEDIQFPLDREMELSHWLISVAENENVPFRELSCVFCSDNYLLDMNNEYLGHDYYTDIITFPFEDNAVHGDLFISADRVRDNAVENGVDFHHELCRVLVHGVLHLCGYGDKTDEDAAQMRAKENEYLAACPLLIA